MTESKILLVLDKKDYEDGMPVFERKCVRAIIEKNGKIAVQRGRAGDCKILGGGMDGEEDFETALSREVLEEGGLILCPGSMQLLGEIEENAVIYLKQIKYITVTPISLPVQLRREQQNRI